MIPAWLGLCTLVWLGLHAGLRGWGARWRLDRGVGTGSVRVCVPARDEAHQVGECVRSLAGFDVVVVDDRSADATADVARAAGARVIAGTEPPPGWAGKPWACQHAASDADTDWLLFVDADVRVAPGAVHAAVAAAERDGLDLLSLYGTWRLDTFWERVAIPAIGWFIRGAVDLDAVNEGRAAFANGQFLLIRTATWRAVGGHGAVRGAVLDDVGMAIAMRDHGGRVGLRWAPWAFEVRLYRSLGAIVAGYRKNLFEGMGRRRGLAVAAVLLTVATSVLPVLALPFLPLPLAAWAAGVVALAMAHRWRLERLDGRSGAIAWAQPLGAAVLAWALASSAVSRRVTWKGRAFEGGQTKTPSRGEGVSGAGDET